MFTFRRRKKVTITSLADVKLQQIETPAQVRHGRAAFRHVSFVEFMPRVIVPYQVLL